MTIRSADVTHESLIEAIRRQGLRQADLAIGVGASQSQVSRVLSGEAGKRSRLYGRIRDYLAGRNRAVSRRDVQQCEVLVDALVETWDGSHEQARALAAVIRSLAPLTHR